MSKNVIIIGASGHAKIVADILLQSGDNLLGFLDDGVVEAPWGYPLLGTTSEMLKWKESAHFIVAIGNAIIRERLMSQEGYQWYTVVHPTAIIGRNVTLGVGSVVVAGAIVNCDTCIGRGVIINTSSSVDHECNLGDFVHISVGAHLGGGVQIDARTWVGIGATVKNHLHICADCLIGAGAVVVRDITEPGTYVGVPAGKIR